MPNINKGKINSSALRYGGELEIQKCHMLLEMGGSTEVGSSDGFDNFEGHMICWRASELNFDNQVSNDENGTRRERDNLSSNMRSEF